MKASDRLAKVLVALLVQVITGSILLGFYLAGYREGATFATALLILLDMMAHNAIEDINRES